VSDRHRGLAIGLIGTGIGIGFVVAGWAARTFSDWRTIYLFEASLAAAVMVAIWFLVRRPPESGAAPPSLRSLASVPAWRVTTATYAGFGLSMSLFVNFLVTRLQEDAGWAPGRAATVFAVFGAASVFGGPVFGRLSDRTGRAAAMSLGFGAMAASALMALVDVSPWPYLAAILFGLSFGGVPTATAAHLRDHLSIQQFGSAFGVITLGFGAGQLAAPLIGGYLGDTMGSFTVVFVLAATVAAISSAASLIARRQIGRTIDHSV
jgi:predicted MFS family arabinose efflux permease